MARGGKKTGRTAAVAAVGAACLVAPTALQFASPGVMATSPRLLSTVASVEGVEAAVHRAHQGGQAKTSFFGASCAGVSAACTMMAASRRKVQQSLKSSISEGKNDKGLDFVTLEDGDAEATIYLFGATVTSFKTSGKDWLAVRPDAKMDGSKAISGGLPLCWPQFGNGAIQQHGFARNLPWTLVKDRCTGSKAVLEMTDSDATRAMWDQAFRLEYVVELKDNTLDTELIVENPSSSDFEFTGAIHSYYSCGNLDDITISGPFSGKDLLDKTQDPPSTSPADSDSLTISKFTEQIYKDAWPGSVVLSDPSKGDLTIESTGGWKDVVVWSPYGDENLGASGFVCVESAAVLTPQKVAAKGSWKAGLKLSPK